MVRLILGLVKGAIIGGALGFGAFKLGLAGGWGYLVYGAVGALVGLLVGRPFWSHLADASSTIWTSTLKAIFGFGVAVGIYALVRHVTADPELTLMNQTHRLTDWPLLFGAGVGAIYGAWVEVDDAPPKKPKEPKELPAKQPAKLPPKKK